MILRGILKRVATKIGIVSDPGPRLREAQEAKEQSFVNLAEDVGTGREAANQVIRLREIRRRDYFSQEWTAGLKGD